MCLTTNNTRLKYYLPVLFATVVVLLLDACTQQTSRTLITIADARNHPAQILDTGEPGDSVGDILLFDQPLLDKDLQVIGNNSGSCTRTRVGHSFQCQWTLSFGSTTDISGSIQVAGREYDTGESHISIVGGSGEYAGISGEMISTNNEDGTFTQVLHFRLAE